MFLESVCSILWADFSFDMFCSSLLILYILSPAYLAEPEDVNKNVADQQTGTNEQVEEEEELSLPGSTLFVKNLNYSTTEDSLTEVRLEFTELTLRVGLRGADMRVLCQRF